MNYFVFDFTQTDRAAYLLSEADLNAALTSGAIDPAKVSRQIPAEGIANRMAITEPVFYIVPALALAPHAIATGTTEAID